MQAAPANNMRIQNFLEDPLTEYRKQASFNWKTMKTSIYGETSLHYLNKIWKFFEKEKLFYPPSKTLSLDESRHLTQKRVNLLKAKGLLPTSKELWENPDLAWIWCEAVLSLNSAVGSKAYLAYGFFASIIRSLGTEKHQIFAEAADNGKINGCFALTEVSHGSNAEAIRTTAIYDAENKEFIVNTPDFEAAKCWITSLSQSATHMILIAKLITPDGVDRGCTPFLVPLRFADSLKPYPGVIIGDVGLKVGLNETDHGFVMFDSYRITKDALLNKCCDIDDAGRYSSIYQNRAHRLKFILGSRSTEKIFITNIATNSLQKAIIIGVRYSAVRKQYEPENIVNELSIIEYQQVYTKLIPYIAVAYASKIFYYWLVRLFAMHMKVISGPMNLREVNARTVEINMLASLMKTTTTWRARDCIQVCKEVCGSHGYLEAAGLGNLGNENDASCSYEGENYLLSQQHTEWLIDKMRKAMLGLQIDSPYTSAEFLNKERFIINRKAGIGMKIIRFRFTTNVLLDSYEWLLCYILKSLVIKRDDLTNIGQNPFEVRNNTQVHLADHLSEIFIEYSILKIFNETVNRMADEFCKKTLEKLVLLYGAWNLEKYLGDLYTGEHFCANDGEVLREYVVSLCKDLKSEAVALVDVLAPPDFILNSILGMSGGDVYQYIQSEMFSFPEGFTRPKWWKDILKEKCVSKL